MLHTVVVSFGPNAEFEYKLHDQEVRALSREEATQWLQREFEALDCAPRNPIGKILLLDIILDVAKYSAEERFAAGGEWPKRFALCCAATLKRDTIRVDVPNLLIA